MESDLMSLSDRYRDVDETIYCPYCATHIEVVAAIEPWQDPIIYIECRCEGPRRYDTTTGEVL